MTSGFFYSSSDDGSTDMDPETDQDLSHHEMEIDNPAQEGGQDRSVHGTSGEAARSEISCVSHVSVIANRKVFLCQYRKVFLRNYLSYVMYFM